MLQTEIVACRSLVAVDHQVERELVRTAATSGTFVDEGLVYEEPLVTCGIEMIRQLSEPALSFVFPAELR